MGTDWCWDLLPSIMDTIGLKDERQPRTFQARSKRCRIEMKIKNRLHQDPKLSNFRKGKDTGMKLLKISLPCFILSVALPLAVMTLITAQPAEAA